MRSVWAVAISAALIVILAGCTVVQTQRALPAKSGSPSPSALAVAKYKTSDFNLSPPYNAASTQLLDAVTRANVAAESYDQGLFDQAEQSAKEAIVMMAAVRPPQEFDWEIYFHDIELELPQFLASYDSHDGDVTTALSATIQQHTAAIRARFGDEGQN